MPNTSAIWQPTAHTTNHHLLAAQREQYKKASLIVFTKNVNFWKEFRRMDH